MTVIGRRHRPPLPDARSPETVFRVKLLDYLRNDTQDFDSLPAPHADTHLLDGSDPLQAPTDPSTIEAGVLADAGAGPAFAAEDHVHPVSTGAPAALGTAEAEGAGAALARATHVHKRAVEVQLNDVLVAVRRILDLKDSATVTWSVTDNAGADRVEATPSTTGASSVVTPAQITSDQNDYSPGVGEIVRASSDAARNITGLLAGASGARRWVVNVGSFNITIRHQDAASAAANRFLCQGAADIVLTPDFAAVLWYDATTARWRAYAL